jgi:hypothetical protein
MPNSADPSLPESHGYAPTLKRLRQLTKILDNAITIPGTQVGIGLDPIIGLLPVGGDFLGLALSFYIIIESARLGVSKATVGRMIINVIFDSLVGVIPMLGDLFDFTWKANTYNIQLLEESLKSSNRQQKADKWFMIALIAGLLLLLIVLIAIPIAIMRMVWTAFTAS